MTVEVLWLPEALQDIERLYDFLSPKNAEAAADAVLCIQAAAGRLQAFPEIGRSMDDRSFRREIFAAFGAGAYVLRYRINADGNPVVLRMWHSREHRELGQAPT